VNIITERITVKVQMQKGVIEMNKIFILFGLVSILCGGCAPMRMYECRDIECRVLGIDASIPIPFAQSVNIMNIRLGWVETKYFHGYKVRSFSDVTQRITYFGDVHRVTEIGKLVK